MKKHKRVVIFTVICFLTIITLFMTGYFCYERLIKSIPDKQIVIISDIVDPFSEQKVREYLIELKVKFPNVAIAQMKLESANGTSNIFRQNNNLFGMKMAGKRPTTALGTRNNHAYYAHWRNSCVDYALYQAYFMNADNIASEKDWLDFVGQMYAEDQSYRKKLIARIGYGKSNKESL